MSAELMGFMEKIDFSIDHSSSNWELTVTAPSDHASQPGNSHYAKKHLNSLFLKVRFKGEVLPVLLTAN